MTTRIILAMLVGLIWTIGLDVPTSSADSTLIGSTVERVDKAHHTVTLRTRDGQSRTFGLANPDLLEAQQVAQGDRVSIEIGGDEEITKIVRLQEKPTSPDQSQQPPDRARPAE